MSNAHGTATQSRAWIGNALALLLVVVPCFALLAWHDEAWWPAPPSPRAWAWAAGITLLYLVGCAWQWRRARAASAPATTIADGGPIPWLVAHASQTGEAHALARQTAASLAAAGVQVVARPLGHVDVALLSRTRRALFVASTTGEGDAPDPALAFVRDVMAGNAALDRLQYAVLALGDRSYAHYCGFGHALDHWLRQGGATPLFDLVEVDNGDAGALRHWQHHLALAADMPDLPDWTPPQYQRWTLQARRRLNPGSVGGPVFHLVLRPPPGDMPAWTAGDIAEIGPRQPAASIEALVSDHGWAGESTVVFQGARTTLRDALARAQLPRIDAAAPLDAQALAAMLTPLPHREYSIASLPADGTLDLLVRRMTRDDGSPGLGSGWLCDEATVGGAIDLRIRANPNFHPPGDARPLVLIGNGTGIAGLRAHLQARIAAGARGNWLLFGERSPDHDRPYGAELRQWQAQGWLDRVDLAFSRDLEHPAYVQHRLHAAAGLLREWVDRGASILVCGNATGMAPAVDAALAEVLGEPTRDALRAGGRYRRDVY